MIITPTSKAWARRIINGNVLLTLSLVLNAAALGKLFEDKLNRKARKISTCVFTVLIAAVICINGYSSLSKKNSYSREKVEEAAEYIIHLKEEDSTAVLCANAWYQAPIISFAAGQSFSDFYELMKYDRIDFRNSNYYLITDQYQSNPTSKLSMFESIQLYGENNPFCSVYWIKGYLPYNHLFSDQDLASEHISLLTKDSDYQYVKGMYSLESESQTRWAQKYSGMILDYHSESDLLIRFYVPAYDKRNTDEADFTVYINGDIVYEKHITHGGNYSDQIKLQSINLQEGPQIVTVLFNSCVVKTTDERELSWCLDRIGFVDNSPSKNEDSKDSATVYTLPSEKTLAFSGSDSVLIQTNSSSPFSSFSFEMDLCIEDQASFRDADILHKWEHWKNEMSILFGLKEEKSFMSITNDGVSPNSIWFDNSLINDGNSHHVKYQFDHGEGILEIDGISVISTTYPFTTIYNSPDTLLTLGEGLTGWIKNFTYSFETISGQ